MRVELRELSPRFLWLKVAGVWFGPGRQARACVRYDPGILRFRILPLLRGLWERSSRAGPTGCSERRRVHQPRPRPTVPAQAVLESLRLGEHRESPSSSVDR